MDNRATKGKGRSRLQAPSLRQDAVVRQARASQAKGPPPVLPTRRARADSEPVPKPPTGSERRAAKRLEVKQNAAATSIQRAFRSFQVRKGVKAASANLQASIKGDMPDQLAKLVGQSYVDSGLLRPTSNPISRASGRLAGDWSGGVATQKDKLNAQGHLDPIGTTHHTVSDHFLGFVNAGVKRLESGSVSEQTAARGLRTQIAKDSLYGGADHEKALFQVRQNLTYGPISDRIKGDPGIGFDATFSATGKSSLPRDWDARSTAIRPVHNIGLLLKSGHFELTDKGGDHLTKRLESARTVHDKELGGTTYDVPQVVTGKGGVKTNVIEKRAQTIPVHGEASGHFSPVTIHQRSGTVAGVEKRKWK